MKRWIIVLAILLTSCAGGVSNLQTATDKELFHDLTVGSAWQPMGHHDAVKAELRQRHPESDWARIDQGKVATGMIKEEVIMSWGFPHDVNKSRYSEQWVYRRGLHGTSGQYLYFEGDTMTAFN